jgi:hypothetical protein
VADYDREQQTPERLENRPPKSKLDFWTDHVVTDVHFCTHSQAEELCPTKDFPSRLASLQLTSAVTRSQFQEEPVRKLKFARI